MIHFLFLFACGESTTDETGTSDVVVECTAWQDSCGACDWVCTPIEEKPDYVCDQECSHVQLEGSCERTEDNECAFSE